MLTPALVNKALMYGTYACKSSQADGARCQTKANYRVSSRSPLGTRVETLSIEEKFNFPVRPTQQ